MKKTLLPLFLCLSACASQVPRDEQTFKIAAAHEISEAWCKAYQRCDLESFVRHYASLEICAEVTAETLCAYGACDGYVVDEVQLDRCIEGFANRTCTVSALPDACVDVLGDKGL